MYRGDFPAGAVVDVYFYTDSGGVPTTLAGTPTARVYKDNSLTEDTAGVSAIDVDFDGVTGLHHLRVDTAGGFYASGSTFHVVLQAGTVDGITVVGRVVASFSILARSNPTASAIATAVWAAGTRTLTAFGGAATDIAAAVWDYLVSAIVTSGSVGAYLISNLALIRSKSASVFDPDTRKITLVRGDDYPSGQGGIPAFTSTEWPDLTGAEIRMTVRRRNGTNADAIALSLLDNETIRDAGGEEQSIAFEPLSAASSGSSGQTGSTDELPVGTNSAKWDVQATLADGTIKTLIFGLMDVIEDQTRP